MMGVCKHFFYRKWKYVIFFPEMGEYKSFLIGKGVGQSKIKEIVIMQAVCGLSS